MKKLANDRSALSEIVGALMLVLIVVIAASSFAVFISQQQKIQQDNQLIKTQQTGESLSISSLGTTRNSTGSGFTNLTITISSMHQSNSQINRITINDHVLRTFNYTLINSITLIPMNYTKEFIISPQQTIVLSVSILDFFGVVDFGISSPITVILYTSYSNEFSKVFFPPTSIININEESQWNSSSQNYSPFLILDGSGSDQAGDTTIVRWNWTAECGGVNYPVTEGRKVRFDPAVPGKYNITLLVENANGMVGISKTIFYH